jgi:hypothetical protein
MLFARYLTSKSRRVRILHLSAVLSFQADTPDRALQGRTLDFSRLGDTVRRSGPKSPEALGLVFRQRVTYITSTKYLYSSPSRRGAK